MDYTERHTGWVTPAFLDWIKEEMTMAGKSEGGETLHDQRNLTEDEIAERTKAKLKADAEESEKVRKELDAENEKAKKQAEKEAEEVKADEEKKEAEAKGGKPGKEASGAAAPHAAPQHAPASSRSR